MGLERLGLKRCDHTGGGHILHSPYCNENNITKVALEVDKKTQQERTQNISPIGGAGLQLLNETNISKVDDPIGGLHLLTGG